MTGLSQSVQPVIVIPHFFSPDISPPTAISSMSMRISAQAEAQKLAGGDLSVIKILAKFGHL
jgi:hypothetical protein